MDSTMVDAADTTAPPPKQLTEHELADGLRQLRTDFRTAAIAHVGSLSPPVAL